MLAGDRRVRLVRSRAPCGSTGSLGCVRYIPVRTGDRQVAFIQFPCTLEVAEDVRVRSVIFRAPLVASCSFVRFLFIPLHSGVRSGAFGSFPCALGIVGCVLSISVRKGVCSGAFTPSLAVLGFVRLRSIHSRAPSD